jgi:glutathione S-transferase
MEQRAQIIGSYLSPYVRKVLVVLDLKGISLRDRSHRSLLRQRSFLADQPGAAHSRAYR